MMTAAAMAGKLDVFSINKAIQKVRMPKVTIIQGATVQINAAEL